MQSELFRVFKPLVLTLLCIGIQSVEGCPANCNCFGYNGEWITDCVNKTLTEIPEGIDLNTTELLLQGNQISMINRARLTGLSNVRHLYLHENFLSTFNSNDLDELISLEYLRVHDNQLTNMNIDFTMNPNIKMILAQRNQISHITRNTFTGLPNIEIISLGNNGLTTIDQDSFCNLGNLRSLDLSGWSIDIPNISTFTCIPKLETLHMNNINTLQCDDQLKEFKQWADDRTNPLQSQVAMSCGSPAWLEGVSLVNLNVGNLVGSDGCPSDCFCFSNVVDCANKGLSSFPADIPSGTKELFLQGNAIRALSAYQMIHLPNLTYLYLHDNSLVALSELAFGGVGKTLKTLTLHDNQIQTLPTGLFRDSTALQVLNLNDNAITRITSILLTNATNLVQLSLYNNEIDTIGDVAFSTLKKLRYLGLANNRLTEVPDLSANEFPELYLTDFSDNLLETLPAIPSAANVIFANGNSIKSLQAATFDNANSLEELLLVNNDIASIADNTFAGASGLAWIDLTANKLSSVNDKMFASLSALEGLYLGSNLELDQISQSAFSSFSSTLRRLSINNCSFSHLDPKVLSYLSNDNLALWLADNPWICDCKLQGFAAYVVDKGSAVSDIENVICRSPEKYMNQRIDYVSFDAMCQNLALIIALPIAGAVLLFAVASFAVYKCGRTSQRVKSEDSLTDDPAYQIMDSGNGYENKGMSSEKPDKATVL